MSTMSPQERRRFEAQELLLKEMDLFRATLDRGGESAGMLSHTDKPQDHGRLSVSAGGELTDAGPVHNNS